MHHSVVINFSMTLQWAFEIKNVEDKIKMVRQGTQQIFEQKTKVVVPLLPARDVEVLDFKSHPTKKGFSTKEGQARMLHDLASIELQAMELGLRTLLEFPESDQDFKEELLALTLSEADHLELCLNEMQGLGYSWGAWPINCGLWTAVHESDSMLDRLLIVHRYLEGSGLDAGDTLLKRLAGVDARSVQKAVQVINTEEIGHVQFGSRWYREFCHRDGVDPEQDFSVRMDRLRAVLPKRINPIQPDLRRRAGFSENEIAYLEQLRQSFLEKESIWKK